MERSEVESQLFLAMRGCWDYATLHPSLRILIP